MSFFQPRYVAYARAHGHTPEDQLAEDATTYPGGRMTGFLVWINAKWREWDRLTGRKAPHTDADHAAFDSWLEAI